MYARAALLDTNALFSIASDDLAAAKKNGWYLTTTPWTFFERLRHLADEKFANARAILLKAQVVDIIDKPLDRLVADRQGGSPSRRIWASDLAHAALDQICGANSVEDLKSMTTVDVAGNIRSLEESVYTIDAILTREKTRFQKLVTDVIRMIRSERMRIFSAEERYQAVLDMLTAGESSFRDTEDLDYRNHASEDEIFSFEYVYYAYVVLRAIAQYRAGGDTCAENDFVDGQICAYIPLDKPILIVSSDKELRETLAEVRDLLTDVGLGRRACFKLSVPDLPFSQGGT